MSTRFITLAFILISSASSLNGQSLKTSTADSSLSKFQKAHLAFNRNMSVGLSKFKKSFTKSISKVESNFGEMDIYLLGGMNFAKQNIRSGSFSSPFVYSVEQKNVFKPGFMAGIRMDGKFKNKYPFALALTLNKFSTGTNYKDVKSLAPFIGSFSSFKAEDQLFTMNIAALYKQIIPLKDTSKYKFYFLAGPSVDVRMSGQSLDNQVRDNYRKLFLRAQLGVEFDNNDYYTLFFHYKQGLHSITKSPINTYMNNFELGMMIKANDLF